MITAAHDGHVVNSGSVSLLHADDKSQAASTRLTKDDNGFSFSFVPEGDYILRVTGAAAIEFEEIPNPPHSVPQTRTEEHMLHRYGETDQALHVDGEISGLTVTVPELRETQVNPSQSMFGGCGNQVMSKRKATMAQKEVEILLASFGYSVIDLGNLRDGGLIQQAGGPLAGRDLLEGGESHK